MLWLLFQLALFLLTIPSWCIPCFLFMLTTLPFPWVHNLSHVNYHDVLEGKVDDCVESLGIFRRNVPFLDPWGNVLFLDPYSLYLVNVPVKIMFTLHSITLKIVLWHLINLGEHSLFFWDSCLSAFTLIHLSCILRHLISSCALWWLLHW